MKSYIALLFRTLFRRWINFSAWLYIFFYPGFLVTGIILLLSNGPFFPSLFKSNALNIIILFFEILLLLTALLFWPKIFQNIANYSNTVSDKVRIDWYDYRHRKAGEIWKLNIELEKLESKRRDIREDKKSLEEENRQIERKMEGLKHQIRRIEESYI